MSDDAAGPDGTSGSRELGGDRLIADLQALPAERPVAATAVAGLIAGAVAYLAGAGWYWAVWALALFVAVPLVDIQHRNGEFRGRLPTAMTALVLGAGVVALAAGTNRWIVWLVGVLVFVPLAHRMDAAPSTAGGRE